MREQIEQILDNFETTIKFNENINSEVAFTVTVDALMDLIKQRNT
jgi:hypothetical protein